MKLALVLILFLLYFSYIGSYICEVFNKYLYWNKIKFPIGFLTTVGLIQLISFPLAYLQVSMQFTSICYLIVIGGLFLVATIYFMRRILKKDRCFQIKNRKEILFLSGIILVFVFLHLGLTFITNSLNVASSDQSFYITWVENNVNAEHINMITPLTGEIGRLHLFYNFQGYYLFLTFIAQVFGIQSLLVSVWIAPIFLLAFIATSILNVCLYFNLKNKLAIISFFILAFIFNFWPIESLVKYNMCNGYLRGYFFIYIIIAYYELFRKNKISYIFINLVWLASVAVQSTSLFNGYLCISALVLYDIFIAKKNVIFELFKSSIGLHIYLFFFLRYSYHYKLSTLFFIVVLMGLVIDRISTIKNWCLSLIYHGNMKKFIIIGYGVLNFIVLLTINYGYLSTPISSSYFVEYINQFYFDNFYYTQVGFSLLSTLLKFILLAVTILLMTKIVKLPDLLRFFVCYQVILFVFFYNPLTSPFISAFITGSVYFRLRDIVFCIPLIIVYFIYVKNNIRFGKLIIIGVTIMSSALMLANIYDYLTFSYNHIPNPTMYNYFYRLPKDTVDVSLFLNEYVEQNYKPENCQLASTEEWMTDVETCRPKIYSTNRQINYFSNKYEMLYTIHEERNLKNINIGESFEALDKFALEQLVVHTNEHKQHVYKYRSMLSKYKVDLIVLENNVSDIIKGQTLLDFDRIYYNDTFSVYKLK